MRTTFHQNSFSNRQQPKGKWWAIAIIFFLLIIVFGGPILDSLLGGAALKITKPFWTTRNYLLAGLQPLASVFQTKRVLIEENKKLRQELEVARLLRIDYGVLEQENEELRFLAGLGSTSTSLITGKIVSHPWNSPYDILMADVSSSQNRELIKTKDLVTYHRTLALGKVEKVTSGVAKVILFSIGSSKVAAVIGKERIPVMLSGRGNGNFVTELPRNVEVVLGSPVLLVDGKKDYTLGVVGAISKTPGETLQTIYVRSPINISDLTYVEIHSN